MVRHLGGDVDVSSGSGFSSRTGDATPIVQLTVTPNGTKPAFIHLSPAEARAIGTDLIAAASQAIADTTLRELAKRQGTDPDELLLALRVRTDAALGEG